KYKAGISVQDYSAMGPSFGVGYDLGLFTNSGNYCYKYSFESGLLSEDQRVSFEIEDYE
ncbi:4001_t:CDS:1, partial [Ambispora gerdemannii]